MAVSTLSGKPLYLSLLLIFNVVAMFLLSPFIDALTNLAVTVHLTSAYLKQVCSVYKLKIGGLGLELH